jgi:protein-S-isoprenylcysteine O-methyltransferase Ste14
MEVTIIPTVRTSSSVPHAGVRIFAWSGAILFAAALLYFLYSYLVTFGETTAGRANAAAIAWDVALFSLFACHHSLFARERVRARMARLAGPDGERPFYVWMASLLLIATCALWQPVAGVLWRVDGVGAWGLRLVQLAGAWLTLRSAAAIDVWALAGVKPASDLDARIPDPHPQEFKTTGPYGWVRHPIYSGWFLIVFAVPTMTMTQLVFAVTSGVYLLVAMPLEELSLLATTDGAYGRYMRQVRWRLVPGVY